MAVVVVAGMVVVGSGSEVVVDCEETGSGAAFSSWFAQLAKRSAKSTTSAGVADLLDRMADVDLATSSSVRVRTGQVR